MKTGVRKDSTARIEIRSIYLCKSCATA